MFIRVGFEIAFTFPEPTALVLMLSLHPSVDTKIRSLENLRVEPTVTMRLSRTMASRMSWGGERFNTNRKIFRMMFWYSCWPADIAKWTVN